jgi:hypothetical protein
MGCGGVGEEGRGVRGEGISEGDESWQSELLASILDFLTKKDLGGTLAFFDANQVCAKE